MLVRAIALSGLLATVAALAPTSAAQAAPLPAKAELRQVRHADVDGDGRPDIVRVYDTGKKGDNTIWKVGVTTAAGRTGSVTFGIPSYQTTRPWYGWAKVDGRRGAELLFKTRTDKGLALIVLTWSDGKLHIEKGPASSADPTQKWGHWFAWQDGGLTSGYRFFSANGQRYVNAWDADCPKGAASKACNLETVRSVWRDGSWRTVAELPARKVPRSEVLSRSPLGALKVHS